MIQSDPIEQVRAGLADLVREDRRSWTASGRSARLVELVEAAERLEAELVRCLGEWDAQADWAVDGGLSPRAWLTHRAPISGQRASRLVSAARLCREHEATGEALARGALSSAHVEVLAPMIRNREEEYTRNESALLDAARDLRADDFAVVARHWRGVADDELSQLDAAAMLQRRNLHVSKTLGGMGAIVGDLDAEGTETLLEALDLAAPPDVEGCPLPPRTVAQRRADGLVDIAAAFLASQGNGGRPAVSVDGVVDIETLGGRSLDPRAVRCELTRIGPVPLETIRRLLCDCSIGRVIMRGESEVLDLGRRERVANRALRRALELRDRRCAFPGCDRPVEWCDVHHLVPWERGGRTNLDNCCLLCRRHHMLVHEGGWVLRRADDGTYEAQEPRPGLVPRRRRRRWRAPPIAA
jgi:Domain of unknown function (DUF222)/HNH endonuclease